MSESPTSDIAGQWNGLYAYHPRYQNMPSIRFQALFSPADSSGQFGGEIIDGADIGEAKVTGSIEGNAVRFVKTYRWSRFTQTRPIQYEGTLSEDGLYLTGIWQIDGRLFGVFPLRTEGVWRAQRPHLPEPPLTWPPPPQAV